MNTMICGLMALAGLVQSAGGPYASWAHTGSIAVLTTPEGANLPAAASEKDFPVLVWLHRDFFDFGQAGPHGEDIRFSTPGGTPLPYQIEQWDPREGTACVWVRLPEIKGNSRQEVRMHWGKAGAAGESNGAAVFNQSNGYLSVWHMSEPVRDEVGTLESKDVDTTAVRGVVGPARHLAGRQGIFCGDKIPDYPTGADPHSSSVWFRPEKPNGRVLGWGNEQAQGKVVMNYRSPPHVQMDCYFSGANVAGGGTVPMGRWVHVVHTCRKGDSRLYINGKLDGVSDRPGAPLSIKSPARMWIGGWYHNYDFVGDVDEVRISKVVRSADWVRLEYENQKPMQTLVGPVVQPGDAFAVSPAQVEVPEGRSAELTARAGGAQKIYWVLKDNSGEEVVAVDRLSFAFQAGRVHGDASCTLRLKAVYPDAIRSVDVPVRVREDIPEPAFTLRAPAGWDGRKTVEVVPVVSNLDALRAKNADKLSFAWSTADVAVTKRPQDDKLLLLRSQNSGPLTVTLRLDNGGQAVEASATIQVHEPPADPYVRRTPDQDEMPEDNQFYARDEANRGTLYCNGTLKEPGESVFLRLYAGDNLVRTEKGVPGPGGQYSLSVPLKPGLVKFRVEFGTVSAGRETVLHRAGNLVCGDVYLINGQSNAVATDFGKEDPTYSSDWIRTFGNTAGDPRGARLRLWGNAAHRSPGGKLQIGYWGMELARRLVEEHKMPICILNGAVGGTRIDQHQRNDADSEDVSTIYGRLLWRVRQARLTHGVRGILWHQGENDQGADGPTGGFGWETYRRYFFDLAAAWKQDYPNVQHYYVFQIWPRSCAMGVNGSDNVLREVQRSLRTGFSNLRVMSTLGIKPPGPGHYPAAGYAEMARLICPLVEQDNYKRVFDHPVGPADLQCARYAGDKRDEIELEFDQPMAWSDALVSQFYLDGQKGQVASGRADGKTIRLKLRGPSKAEKITYLDSASWSQDNLLYGQNGVAALTFWGVPVLPPAP